MTLIELLVAAVVSVMIVGVVVTAFITSIRLTETSKTQLAESHDAQFSAAFLPADLLSAGDGGVDTEPSTATGCAASPTEPWNVARLRWSEAVDATTTYFVAAYRVRQEADEWQLVRYSCQGAVNPPEVAADIQVVARNLKPVVVVDDLPDVSEDGTRVTITVTDASGYSYTISGTRRMAITAASPSPSPSPTPSPLLPVAEAVTLVNVGNQGDVAVDVRFSTALPAGCIDNFDIGGLSGRGSFSGLAVISGDTARLSIVRGANSPNTAVDSLTVSVSDGVGCAVTPLVAAAPADVAAPVLLSFDARNGSGTPRKFETGDALAFTFSEPVSNLPATVTAELHGNTNLAADALSVIGVLAGEAPLGRSDYISNNNKDAIAEGPPVADGASYSVALTVLTCNGGCAEIAQAAGPGIFTYTASADAADAAGNSLASRDLTAATVVVPIFAAF